jgi:PAS domain S-box-containing protein
LTSAPSCVILNHQTKTAPFFCTENVKDVRQQDEKLPTTLGNPDQPETYKMTDEQKTKGQLVCELAELRRQIAELEASETEHKRVEKALPESEEKFRSLAEHSHAGIFIVNDAYQFTYVNDELCRILGSPREELIGQDFRGFLDTESRHLVVDRYVRRQRGEAPPSQYQFNVVQKDGKKRQVEIISSVIKDSAGNVQTMAQIMDITERKQAEEERERLLATEREQRVLAETLADVTLALTSQTSHAAVLDEILRQARRIVPYSMARITLLEDDTLQVAHFQGYEATGREESISNLVLPLADVPLDAEVIESRQPVVIRDTHQDPRWVVLDEMAWVRSLVMVPICLGDRALGLLMLDSDTPGEFTAKDAERLQPLASAAAIALENTRLYEAERKRVTQLTVVNQVARKAISILDPDRLLQEIVIAIQHGFGYYSVALFLLDETGSELEFSAVAGGLENLASPDYRQAVGVGMIGWAAEIGQSILANDVSLEPRYITGFPEEIATQSELCVPLKLTDRVIGVLDVQQAQVNAFDETDLTTMETLADQIAVAIENAQLVASLAQDKERLELLHRLSRRISESLDVHDVAQRALDDICAVVGAQHGVVVVQEQGTDRLRLVAVSGYEAESLDALNQQIRLRVGVGLTGWVAAHRVPALVQDVTKDERWMGVQGMNDWVHSALSVPLVSRDKLQGVLSIYSDREGMFNNDHRRLVESAAANVTAAIANAQLYEAEWHRRQEAETLREAALTLTTTLDRDEVVERILAQLQEVVPYDSASIQLLCEDRLEIVGGRGFPNLSDLLGTSFPIDGDNPNREVIRTRAPFIVEDAPTVYTGFRECPHMQAAIRSWLGVPMLVSEQLVGMLALDKREPAFYTQKHARLAEAFAAQAAIAVENSRLFQAEREQRELAEALEGAAGAVSSTLDLDQVLDHILEQVERVVAGDTFNIMLIEDGTASVVRRRGYESLRIQDPTPNLAISIARYPNLVSMVQTGKPVIILDTATDSNWIPSAGEEWRHSYVATPVRVGGATVGFLNVSGTRPGQFGPADARRLETFASHAATAIENARLYQELQDHAELLEERVQERTAEIQAQYAQLNAILRSTTDGIVVTDAAGEIIQANPVTHTWLTQTLSPEDAGRLRQAVQDLAWRAEEQPEAVLELTGLDLELKAAPVFDSGKKEATAVVNIHDVSHLKALDRIKTRFVSNVSHELRTPVTTIKLYTHLMQQTPPTAEKWEEYLRALAEEADRQARLVEHILQISRIDAGRLEMKPRPISLNELAETASINHQVLAQERELTLTYHPLEPGPVALVDPERMMQVLNNLVENAIRYTPAGEQVLISTGQEEAEGRVWTTVTVADTGMGIPEGELPHVFERFYRGERPRLMQITGTGLGLAIVKEIVELHGGRVTVESQVGKGTTFTIWLPLAA